MERDFDGRRIGHFVVPIEHAAEMATGLMLRFIRERLRRHDPGPVYVVEGVASTPMFDIEQAHPWNLEWVMRFSGPGARNGTGGVG